MYIQCRSYHQTEACEIGVHRVAKLLEFFASLISPLLVSDTIVLNGHVLSDVTVRRAVSNELRVLLFDSNSAELVKSVQFDGFSNIAAKLPGDMPISSVLWLTQYVPQRIAPHVTLRCWQLLGHMVQLWPRLLFPALGPDNAHGLRRNLVDILQMEETGFTDADADRHLNFVFSELNRAALDFLVGSVKNQPQLCEFLLLSDDQQPSANPVALHSGPRADAALSSVLGALISMLKAALIKPIRADGSAHGLLFFSNNPIALFQL